LIEGGGAVEVLSGRKILGDVVALKKVPVWRRWLGRSGRLEFWISMAAVVALPALVKPIGVRFPPLLLAPAIVWLVATTRRLNDARWRWWWAWIPVATFMLTGVVAGVVVVMTHGKVSMPFIVVEVLAGVAMLATVGYVGSAPRAGDAGAVDVSVFE
jgi:uncharacterized membrane protein YhaH (DUF805 family)